MALKHINNQVQTTPTLIVDLPASVGRSVAVQIFNGHISPIFIGDTTISSSGATIGRTIAANGSLQIWLNGGDKVYAVAAVQTAVGSVVTTFSA